MSGKIKLSYLLYFLILCLSPVSYASIVLDGALNEEEWKEAQVISNFHEVLPFTLKETKYKTEVRIYQDERGLFLGFISYQPEETLRSQQHERDAWDSNADRVGVIIDFDGDSLSAYEFSVSLGGSLRDVIFRNENDQKADWDADWEASTSSSEQAWFVEMLIPWSVIPMKSQQGDFRKVKIGFFRQSMAEGKVYSTVKSNPMRARFVSLLNEFTLKNFSSSKLVFFPYVTSTNDRIIDDTDTKVGAELFWKIDSARQLNLTINPDFGQVESDEVVVNFSAMETFYSDRRPFFSENQTMFDVSGYRFFYVINTRRIGGAPDYNCSQYVDNLVDECEASKQGNNDIDLALRYSQQGENFDFGLLGAFEADEDFSQGKDFFATRLRTKWKDFSIGYLGTYVDSPVFNREAKVHSVDFDYRYSKSFRLTGIFLNSLVDDEEGLGLRLGMEQMPTQNISHYLGFYYFDDDLDLNDMGYLARNGWMLLGGRSSFRITDFEADSPLMRREYTIMYGGDSNTRGDVEPSRIGLEIENYFKNTSQIEYGIFYRNKGKDTMITRKYESAPFVNMPEGYGMSLGYEGPRKEKWGYALSFSRGIGDNHLSGLDWMSTYKFRFGFYPKETLSINFGFSYEQEDKWLNWIEENHLATFDKKLRRTMASLKWFKGNKHELRIKTQLVAFTARNSQSYLANFRGDLTKSQKEVPSFTLSELAFQVRYRYEILPLAYFYLVYTKGGRVLEEDEENDLGKIYKRPWEDPTGDTFSMKLRYKF